MAYTKDINIVREIVENDGVFQSEYGKVAGIEHHAYTIYECLNDPPVNVADVYWVLFFNPKHDHIEADPFIYEIVKIWDETATHNPTAKVGTLVECIQVRQRAVKTLHAKFARADADYYIDEFDRNEGILGWKEHFLDSQGHFLRSELVDDMFQFVKSLGPGEEVGG